MVRQKDEHDAQFALTLLVQSSMITSIHCMLRRLHVCFVLIWSLAAFGQQPSPASGSTVNHASSADSQLVTFALDFPHSQPQHYSIRIPSDGPAHYESIVRISTDSEDTDSFAFDFQLSSETRQKIFALAASAGYFQHDLDSHRKDIAFTGKKTLSYRDGHQTGESTYDFSTNRAVAELTRIFQDLSATLEFGHRLDYDHHYQKLALDDELKRMEEMARSSGLMEVAAIQPILEQIVSDHTVINVARARAQKLLRSPNSR
jgi:hypothetical protein